MKPLTIIASFLVLPLWSAMRINEVQISNDATILDENGEHSDWVELYNDSDSAVDLSGWGLTDKASKLYKWVFPQNTLINPHGYLTVFADGWENNDSSPPVQNVTVLTDSQGNEQLFDSSADNGELVALLKFGGKLQIKDAEVSVDDENHTVTIDGVAYTVL